VMASSILPSCGGVDWEEEEEQQRAVPSRSRTTTGGTSLPSLDPHHAPTPPPASPSPRLWRAGESRPPRCGTEGALGLVNIVERTAPELLKRANHWTDPARVLDAVARPRQPTQSFDSCSHAPLPVLPAVTAVRSPNPSGTGEVLPSAHTNATYVHFCGAEQRRGRPNAGTPQRKKNMRRAAE
jgi:hypothetical protein